MRIIHDTHVSEIENKVFMNMIPPLPTFSKRKWGKTNPNPVLWLMGMKLGVYFSVFLAITHIL